MNKSKSFLIAALLFAGMQGVSAQESVKITLEKAVDIALNENPTIEIAGMEIQRQEYAKKESKGNLLPAVTGNGSYTYNLMNPVMFLPDGMFGPGTGGPVRMGYSNSYSAGATLSVPVFMPTVYKMIQLSQEQINAAVESARASKIMLVNQVKKTYYSILLAENSMEVLKKNMEYAQVIVDNTQKSFNQGVVSEYDLITAQVQLSNLNPLLIRTQNSIRVSKLMLNMLLSLPLDTNLDLEETLYDYDRYIKGNADNVMDIDNNSQLRQMGIQKNMLQKQFELQRSQRIPNLAAFANYQVLSQSNDFQVGHYQWKGTASTGLQLSVPIFSGMTRKNKENQIQSSIEQLSLQEDYLRENVSVEAQTALNDLIRAKEQMLSDEAAKAQANKGYSISKTRFDTGAGTIIEVNSAQMALLQADLNYSQAIFDYMSAQADFDRIVGKER